MCTYIIHDTEKNGHNIYVQRTANREDEKTRAKINVVYRETLVHSRIANVGCVVYVANSGAPRLKESTEKKLSRLFYCGVFLFTRRASGFLFLQFYSMDRARAAAAAAPHRTTAL